MIFAFDVKRRAILLVGGDKSGDWKGWYQVNIPIADARFDQHPASARSESEPKQIRPKGKGKR